MSVNKLFLIDGHALCYRAFYAIASLTNSKGQATNAVYGFIATIRKILNDHEPTHIAVCFDTGKKTRRQEEFKEYKIQRPSMPEDLISQLPIIKEVLSAYHISSFELDGFEADDLLATMAHKFKHLNCEVVIATEDKDMYQLVDKHVFIYSSRLDKVLGVEESQQKFGIKPEFICDYLGLCGDTSDNIPGVKGIGEVTARNLINQFGTIENVYAHLGEVSQAKVKDKLIAQKDEAFLSKKLAVLDNNVSLDLDFEQLRVQQPDKSRLFQLFSELEFRKFAQEFQDQGSVVQGSLELNLQSVSIEELLKEVVRFKRISILQSMDVNESVDAFLSISVDNKIAAVTFSQIQQLKVIIEDFSIQKITYDSKFLRKLLDSAGISLVGETFDVLLAGYLLLSGTSAIDLDTLAWTYLKQSFAGEKTDQKIGVFEKLAQVMTTQLKEKNLWDLYHGLELPLSMVLFEMEKEGVRIDVDVLGQLSKECDLKIKDITARLFALAGCEFNINSPKQLSEVLFVQLKLPVVKKTKTGFSTDEEVLSKLAAKHEIAQVILEYRQISKLKSTYIDALPKLVNSQSHRLHATFNQTGAETGRLSSNNPNLQNIPIRTELGREIRRAFVPFTNDNFLLSADYSQIELRILAHLSQDENLIKAFREGQDIHTYTAGLIFDVAENKVDAQMRNSAKRVNFGIIYGISAFGLAKDLGVSNQEAQAFIDRYFLRYPKVKDFMDLEIQKAQDLGYVTTIFHRRRSIPEINSKNIGLRQFAQRQAINTPVQGSAADLMKMAMIRMQQFMQKNHLQSRMIITVHDELVFNMVSSEKEQMISLVKEAMENVYEFSVPITVSVKVGKNWLQMDKL